MKVMSLSPRAWSSCICFAFAVMLLCASSTASFAAQVVEKVSVAPSAKAVSVETNLGVIVWNREGSIAEYDRATRTLLITRSDGGGSFMEPDAIGRPLVVTRWRPDGEQSESVFIYNSKSDRLERIDFDNGMTAIVQYGTQGDDQVVLILHDADGQVIGLPYEVPTFAQEATPLDDGGPSPQAPLISAPLCVGFAQACLGICNTQQSGCEADCQARFPGVLQGPDLSDCLNDCDLYWDTLCPAGCYAGGAICILGGI